MTGGDRPDPGPALRRCQVSRTAHALICRRRWKGRQGDRGMNSGCLGPGPDGVPPGPDARTAAVDAAKAPCEAPGTGHRPGGSAGRPGEVAQRPHAPNRASAGGRSGHALQPALRTSQRSRSPRAAGSSGQLAVERPGFGRGGWPGGNLTGHARSAACLNRTGCQAGPSRAAGSIRPAFPATGGPIRWTFAALPALCRPPARQPAPCPDPGRAP